jgi:hypothetical protein
VHDPITYFQGAMLGLLQGIAEPFPISSLGHGVLLPRLAHWDIHQNDKFFLTFLIATHLATAIVLFFFFLKDWIRILKGLGRSLRDREIGRDDVDAKVGWLLVIGTIPAGIIGLLLEHPLRKLFASPASAAAFLIVNGFLLFAFERLRRRAPTPDDHLGDVDREVAKLSWRQALAIGTAQAVLDYVVPYVNERHAFGEPVSNRQSVAFMVANIAIELQGMRLVTYRAASRAAQGKPFDREVALARRLCTERGMQIGTDGVQLLGGHGYVKEHPVERWYRDLRAAGLMEGALLL